MPLNQKATRQKSFFDQDTKERPFWSRNQSSGRAPRGSEYTNASKPVANMDPIAPSSQTKTRLGAFRFEGSDNRAVKDTSDCGSLDCGADDTGKENTTTVDEQDKRSLSQRTPQFSQKSNGKDMRECPQTPVGRLPLAELIASGEDIKKHLPNLTPSERVLWYHSQKNEGQSRAQGANIGERRRHSSSPLSSSQNESSNHFESGNPSFDLQKLQKLLKTPQTDLASDLWSRYSSKPSPNTDKPSPIGLAGPSFAMYSSPQTPVKHLALQRSISCGLEWPTSAAKRRKLNQKTDFGGVTPNAGYEHQNMSKMARVSLLVDEIQSTLARPGIPPDEELAGPPSSSPFAEGNDISVPSALRPLQLSEFTRGYISSAPAAIPHNFQHQSSNGIVKPLARLKKSQEVFSDFDDDDFSLEMLQSIDEEKKGCHVSKDARLESNHQSSPPNSPRIFFSDDQKERDSTLQPTTPRKATSSPISGPETRWDSDEFDEFDAAYAADLEDVAAMYDLQPQDQGHKDYFQKAVKLVPDTKNPYKSQVRSSQENSSIRGGPSVRNHEDGAVFGEFSDDDDDCDDDDEFGGGLEFEHIIAECERASQQEKIGSQPQSSSGQKASTIQRHLIITVAKGTYTNENGASRAEKVLLVQNDKTKLSKAIILRGFWVDSPCTAGSYVHLIGDFDQRGQCVVDDSHNLIIVHPDHLLSATVVADSFSCTRRAVLQDRVKATSQLSEPTVYGSMLHEIFQEAMTANRWDTEWLAGTIEEVAMRYLESLFEMNVELRVAVEHLKSKAVDMQAWAEVFVTSRPKPSAIVKDRNGAQAFLCVNKLLDVEEKVWSPVYGLKGMIDATVQVVMQDGVKERTLTVPLELKTGRFPSAAHKAQTALYTLLLSDRYDVEILYGILYYTETSEISRIPAVRHELIHMIMQRNELACYVRHRLELPPMLKSPHLCGRCYAKSSCFVYHKLVDEGNGETSGMGEKFYEVTGHLNTTHQEFFQKWDDLITKEEKVMMRFRRELWTMQSDERQKVGRCFGNVIIDPEFIHEDKDGPKINRFHYAFTKPTPTPGFSFTESQITTGEPVVISDEKGHFALANGYVTKVHKHIIHVAVDRRLYNTRIRKDDFDAERNQTFNGIMEIFENGSEKPAVNATKPGETPLYRIDKDEFSNGMATVRNNLIKLMEKDVFGAQALRKLIIEGVEPTFVQDPPQYSLSSSASQASLNADQRRAIEKVMSAKDYALVLGMPGTGKTTTIAHIIRALAAQGKSILLTSYTHTAVDNILLKIRDTGIGVFRIGNVAKVHPGVQEFANLSGIPMKTVDEIKNAYGQQIVATTCLGINHSIFNQRVFDYCIVDEASQITLPVCLGPIRLSKKFILVGDHYQLPPLVQNKEAQEGGLDISLFKMLSDRHPFSVVNLEHQYRMCEEIMTLSNTLIYDGRLKCGTSAVAQRTLTIPNIDALQKHHIHSAQSFMSQAACRNPARGSCWLRNLIDPSAKVCLVNTDALLSVSREVANGSRIVNECEVRITSQLVESLITVGIDPSEIGVITLYRSQLALLKQEMRQHPSVEMHTADKFQGRDKEVIVLSLVRSNEALNVGDLLKDWRRVNVAFTRARTKLLIIGSANTIKGNDLLADFVNLMASRNWIYNLPPKALEGHVWDEDLKATQSLHSAESRSLSAVGASAQGPNLNVLKDKKNATTNMKKGGKTKQTTLIPTKAGKVDAQRLISRRPVLMDIINDAS